MTATPSTLRAILRGISLIGPGLPGWTTARAVLRGETPYTPEPTVIAPPEVVSPRERRRTSPAMRLALNTALAACQDADVDPATLPAVFSSAIGSGTVTDRIFTALDTDLKQVSPTDFHNSVHNAAAGYWSIGTGSSAPTTSVSAGDAGFGVGLLRALMEVASGAPDVLYVCFEAPFPEPLHTVRPFGEALGVGLVLSAAGDGPAVEATVSQNVPSTPTAEFLRDIVDQTPPGRALALLEHVARGDGGTVTVPLDTGAGLSLTVTP